MSASDFSLSGFGFAGFRKTQFADCADILNPELNPSGICNELLRNVPNVMLINSRYRPGEREHLPVLASSSRHGETDPCSNPDMDLCDRPYILPKRKHCILDAQ